MTGSAGQPYHCRTERAGDHSRRKPTEADGSRRKRVAVAGKLKGFDVAVVINEARCRSCAICYDLCPEDVLSPSDPLRKAVVTNLDACTGCRLCEDACGWNAIYIDPPREVLKKDAWELAEVAAPAG